MPVVVATFYKVQNALHVMRDEQNAQAIKTAIDYHANLATILKMDTELPLEVRILLQQTENVLVLQIMEVAPLLVLLVLKI